MKFYYITDRASAGGDVTERIGAAARAGVDYIQIREKDLTGRELLALACAARERLTGSGTKLLINERADVAIAAGLDGVHLPSNACEVRRIRGIGPEGFVIGVSCHSIGELQRAEDGGADFAVFGPVFDTSSKRRYGEPRGLPSLARACEAVELPVLALGGIGVDTAQSCVEAGAAGVAGISMFQSGVEVGEVVRRLRNRP